MKQSSRWGTKCVAAVAATVAGGLVPALAWAQANAGISPPATMAVTTATHFVPHLLLCFIA